MRFLTGMLFGTALTLLAATAVDAPTHALLESTSSRIESTWHGLLRTTSVALFKSPVAERTAIDHTSAAAEASASVPATVPAPAAPSAPAPVPAIASLIESAPMPATATAPAPKIEPEAERAESDAFFTADLTAEAQAAALAAVPFDLPSPDAAETDTTAVWVPFHSERSALGFARRLTSEIQHPFAVQRKGPGAYQVVYQAASADEIAGLEARIAEVTGR